MRIGAIMMPLATFFALVLSSALVFCILALTLENRAIKKHGMGNIFEREKAMQNAFMLTLLTMLSVTLLFT
jgi:hypothetical protein